MLAESELASAMMGYALRSLGLTEGQAHLYIQSSRSTGEAAMHRRAPELRPHRMEADDEEELPRSTLEAVQ